MDEYIKKEDAIEAVTSLFRVSALFSGMNDNEKEWREKAEKVLAKCEVVTDTADTPQTDCPYKEYPCDVCDEQTDCAWMYDSRRDYEIDKALDEWKDFEEYDDGEDEDDSDTDK